MSTEVKQEKKKLVFKKSLTDAIKKQEEKQKELPEDEKGSDADEEPEVEEDKPKKGKKAKEKKEKKPRSLTCYNVFSKEKWAEKKQNKGADEKITATEVAKELGAAWKALTEEERQSYKDKANEYNEEHGLPLIKEKVESEDKPKRPLTAYQEWQADPEVKAKINEYPRSERRKVRSEMWAKHKADNPKPKSK